jgi:signal transduction histidine kinase
VFERFRRLSHAGTSAVPGTGLGLYIALRFARDLGGDVTVTRAAEGPWTGARFVLRIPSELVEGHPAVLSHS